MSVEVVPTIACNLSCGYCYQDPMRNAGNMGMGRIHLDKVIRSIKKANEGAKEPAFTLFGGEPLLIPRLVLERLWGFGLKEYGHNGIQTNGELIDDNFIDLFVKYNVSVGMSVDGPWPLNAARSSEGGTDHSLLAIEKLAERGRPAGIHIILNRHNARGEAFEALLEWIKSLEGKVSEVRIHLMEVDTRTGESLRLSESENIAAFEALSTLETVFPIEPCVDMNKLLKGDFNVGGTWNGCDPYTTPAVQGVDGDGTLSNCGRVNKDGVAYRKSSTSSKERVLSLYNTPFEAGGCKGCRYFFACKGQCPGEAIGGDWRNRSAHCQSYFRVFGSLEERVGRLTDEDITKYEHQVLGDRSTDRAHLDTHTDIPHIDRYMLRVPVVVKRAEK